MDASIKKIINNSVFIAELAPLIEGEEAADLAEAAIAYQGILHGLGIKPSLADFDGCEQAQLLVQWWRRGMVSANSAQLMREWTIAIQSAIDDLAHGKLPTS